MTISKTPFVKLVRDELLKSIKHLLLINVLSGHLVSLVNLLRSLVSSPSFDPSEGCRLDRGVAIFLFGYSQHPSAE